MSRRTAEASKAILAAWKKEQELVHEGKGTREWTPKQQQDILDKGKAYDEDGVAFQGQHMKSAEKYPEYQGDSENIQFLTRTEHLEAHDGNWRNPTNWYYNPVTKEKTDFNDGKFIPCEIINLTNPIIKSETVEEPVKEVQEKTPKVESSGKDKVDSKPKLGVGQKVKNALKTVKDMALDFTDKHPTATKIIKGVGFGAAAVTIVAAVVAESMTSDSSSKSENDQADNYQRDDNAFFSHDGCEGDSSESVERSSPDEHIVGAHSQRYHTKDGIIWKEKEPFPRGRKKDE